MKFRKRPIVVEAILVLPQYRNLREIITFAGEQNICPIERRPDYVLKIRTSEGERPVYFGDWIVKNPKGDIYPARGEFFEENYEQLA